MVDKLGKMDIGQMSKYVSPELTEGAHKKTGVDKYQKMGKNFIKQIIVKLDRLENWINRGGWINDNAVAKELNARVSGVENMVQRFNDKKGLGKILGQLERIDEAASVFVQRKNLTKDQKTLMDHLTSLTESVIQKYDSAPKTPAEKEKPENQEKLVAPKLPGTRPLVHEGGKTVVAETRKQAEPELRNEAGSEKEVEEFEKRELLHKPVEQQEKTSTKAASSKSPGTVVEWVDPSKVLGLSPKAKETELPAASTPVTTGTFEEDSFRESPYSDEPVSPQLKEEKPLQGKRGKSHLSHQQRLAERMFIEGPKARQKQSSSETGGLSDIEHVEKPRAIRQKNIETVQKKLIAKKEEFQKKLIDFSMVAFGTNKWVVGDNLGTHLNADQREAVGDIEDQGVQGMDYNMIKNSYDKLLNFIDIAYKKTPKEAEEKPPVPLEIRTLKDGLENDLEDIRRLEKAIKKK